MNAELSAVAASVCHHPLVVEFDREQLARATDQIAHWDNHRSRQIACSLLSLAWFSVGGVTVFPVGLLLAGMLLLPEMPSWSLVRRIRFAGWRSIFLASCALVGLLAIQVRIGVFGPEGETVYGLFRIGWPLW